MKEIPVIKLSNLKAQPLSVKGIRHYKIIKSPRPYERVKHKRSKSERETKPFYKKVILQCLICAMVCLLAIIMSNIDWEVTRDATEGLNMALEHESNWKIFEGIREDSEVFSRNTKILLYPVDGMIISEFNTEDYKKAGVMIETTDMVVTSSAEGVIFYVDTVSVSTPYLRIRHDNDFETVYIGVVSDLYAGDKVKAGQVIGRAISSQIGFMVMYKQEVAEPAKYLKNRED